MPRKIVLAAFALGGLGLCSAYAQVKPPEKTPDKPSTPAAQDFSKEAYVLERYAMVIKAESDGTGTREATAEIKMLADAGVKAFAVLNFVYTSANEVVDVDYVRVRKADGTIVKTPDYNIQDMPGEITRTAPLYSDVHEKHIAVKGLGVGDTLEYVIRTHVVKPEVPGHFWYEHSFTKDAISKDESLELNVPRDKYVKVISPEYKPEVKEEGDRRVYRWKHQNLVLKEKDPDELPRRLLPTPDVQVTTFASWEEVGKWYGGLQKEPLTVTPAIQAKAAELTKGLKTDLEKVHAIYNFVSLKFHYVGLDFGIGRYQPHAADDVLDNGYGDCKDKHTLLAALLKAAGYDAWPALINPLRKLDPDAPSPAQFNHLITVVPLSPPIWLDTTPEVAPFQLLLPTLNNKQALVIPTDKPPLLMTTPANPPFLQEQKFTMEGKLGSDGTFTGHAEHAFHGEAELAFRVLFRQVPESQWKEVVQRLSYRLNFGGDVSNVVATPPENLDEPFKLSYDYVRKNYSGWEDHEIVAPLPPLGIEFQKDTKIKPVEPFFLGSKGKIVYHARVVLPANYLAVAPAACHRVEPYGEYSGSTVISDGMMTTNREFIVKQNELPLSDWESFRKFGRDVFDDEYAVVRITRKDGGDSVDAEETADADFDINHGFQRGLDALRRTDNREAERMFRKVIAKDPNYKGAHLGLGTALSMTARSGEAMAEFRKEEEISPDDVSAYKTAAANLLRMGKKDEALEEWRKFLKVDPKSREGVLAVNGMLAEDGRYAEAAQEMEKAVTVSPDNSNFQFVLGYDLLKSGNKEKGTASVKKAVELANDDPEMLNNASYSLADSNVSLDLAQQLAEKAVTKLEEKAQGAESAPEVGMAVTYQLSLTWDTLGWVYFQQGDAKRAESFVKASWQLGEVAIVGEHLGDIYEKQGKTQLAAKAYLYALAVSPMAMVTNLIGPQNNSLMASQKEADEIQHRYEKLAGKKPDLRSSTRLPNGEWTLTPAEQLRRTREVKLANEKKLAGNARFTLVFKPGQVESAEQEFGDPEFALFADKLKAAHYPIEFPTESAAVLVLRVDVSCKPAEPCVGTLVNPVPPTAPSPTH